MVFQKNQSEISGIPEKFRKISGFLGQFFPHVFDGNFRQWKQRSSAFWCSLNHGVCIFHSEDIKLRVWKLLQGQK
jgi:hypothetical protein